MVFLVEFTQKILVLIDNSALWVDISHLIVQISVSQTFYLVGITFGKYLGIYCSFAPFRKVGVLTMREKKCVLSAFRVSKNIITHKILDR